MCKCLRVLNSKGPGIPGSCATERAWLSSFSVSSAALLSLPSWQRGGEDTQGVEQKTEAAFSKTLSLSALPHLPFLSMLFFPCVSLLPQLLLSVFWPALCDRYSFTA